MSEGRIFISYAHEDEGAAKRFYTGLKSAGLDPWIDFECLRPGENWKNAIKQAIKGSRYFLAIISTNSVNKRGYVQKEIKEALEALDEFPDYDIFLIPVRLDECEPSQGRLNDLHRVDMFPNWDNGFAKILSVLQSNGSKTVDTPPKHENEIVVLKGQISALLRQYQADWAIERDSHPLSIENGKNILMRFGSKLFSFRPLLDGKADDLSLNKLDDVVKATRVIQKHQVYIDGGESYRKFWRDGDGIFRQAGYAIDYIASWGS